MNKIVVYRTHIEINNYELKDCFLLEKTFSVWDQLRHRYYQKGIIYDKKLKKLYVPRGVNVSWLEELFLSDAVYDKNVDPYDEIGPTEIKYLPRDNVQQTALRFMLGVEDFEYTSNRPMLSINLPTGKGKTYCSIATMVVLNLRSIIITSSVEWLKQWGKFILEYTDINEKEICFINGSPMALKLMDPSKALRYKVFLCTHATLLSLANSNGWEFVHELFCSLRVGIKFYDEAHLNFDNIYKIDFYTNTYKTYYVTATPGRSDKSEDVIYNNYFMNVPSINLFDRENDPHTEYIAIKYNSHPTAQDISRCKNRYGFDRNKYAEYLVDRPAFYKLLYTLLSMAIRQSGKFLIYIGLNESILKVKEWIEENFSELKGDVGIFTSIIEKEEKNDQLNKKIILSTTKSAGAAVDIKGLVQTINIGEPFKSKILAQQTFGRTRNSDTKYIDVVDTGFSYCNSYYNAKKPIFLKYAKKFSELNLTDEKLNIKYNKEKHHRESLVNPLYYIGTDEDVLIDPLE